MILLKGYIITKLLYDKGDALFYRGFRESDKARVIIKTLKEQNISPEKITTFYHEYNILKKLNGKGSVSIYALEQQENKIALIFENYSDHLLQEIIAQKKFSQSELLEFAIQMVATLDLIHSAGIVYGSLRPDTIYYDAQNKIVKLINFSKATEFLTLTAVINYFYDTELADLMYISPEQTGKINRTVDYRTDYYSLGIILYELSTGVHPFQEIDLSKIIYNHLIKEPLPPHDIDPTISVMFSKIIMKLIEKKSDKRYQSLKSLEVDLVNCLKELQSDPNPSLELTKIDTNEFFYISEKLYGREKAIAKLTDSFNEACQGRAQLVSLTGTKAGTGRKTVVKELYQRLIESNGYMAVGKFQQLKRDIPYSGLVSAIENFIAEVLQSSEIQISLYRKRITQALGSNGQIIIDIIPILGTLIGEQPSYNALGPKENENRFNLTFQNFLNALSAPEHPLIIFLDDIHWADLPSLRILERFLLQHENSYTLIIAGYNKDETDKNSFFLSTLDTMKKNRIPFKRIPLDVMSLADIENLLADTFKRKDKELLYFANLCHIKTHGNPFYLKQLLQKLYDDRLILFVNNKWTWKIADIVQLTISTEINQLLIDTIKRISNEAQILLQIASCIGSEFDLQSLSILTHSPSQLIIEQLFEAMRAGLILPINIPFFYEYNPSSITYPMYFRFSNDHVQKTINKLVDKNIRKHCHIKIGRHLLRLMQNNNSHISILEIVYHINYANFGKTTPDEKLELAKLNLLAGKKAKASVAYNEALKYLQIGIRNLSETAWEDQFELAMALNMEMLESCYLSTNYLEMDKYAEIILKYAMNNQQRAKVYEIRILYLTVQNKLDEAIKTGIRFLNHLGVRIKSKPSIIDVLFALAKMKFSLWGKTTDDLYNLPLVENENAKIILRILTAIIAPAYISDHNLYQIIIFATMAISLKYGITTESTTAFGTYSVILCVIGQVKEAYDYGQLGIRLLNKFNANHLRAKLYTVLSLFILPRLEHLDESISLVIGGIQSGLETGDTEYVGFLSSTYGYLLFLSGKNLSYAAVEIEKYVNRLEYIGQSVARDYACTCLQTVEELTGDPKKSVNLLTGKWFKEEITLPKLISANNNIGILNVYICKMILAYHFHDYDNAYKYAKSLQPYIKKSIGIFLTPHYHFFYALICLEILDSSPTLVGKTFINEFKRNQKKLKSWAHYAPMNYLHKYYLTVARYSQIMEDKKSTINYFDKSIDLARQNRFINDEAIANELAARYYLSKGKDKIAQIYLNDAYYCYKKWGATAKLSQLSELYPNLIKADADSHSVAKSSPRYTSVDLAELMKSSANITRQIEIEKLLQTIINEVIGHTGAQNAYLLLEQNDKWYIEAHKIFSSQSISTKQLPLMTDKLPQMLIQRVINSSNFVVLEDAAHNENFSSDPYIKQNQPKSVLCMPLLNQGILNGILYLENNATIGAFTSDKINLLNLLSAPMVIAIDNAKLYKHRKELNEAYDRFVPHEFLDILKKGSIIDVKLGDQVQKDMTVMFVHIRDFASISEKLTAAENINFINHYIADLEPIIDKNNGIIDKFINDTIMVIFSSAADGVQCALQMLQDVKEKNEYRRDSQQDPLYINIGINSGLLTLGTVGGENRMEGTVISDAVNISARVKTLTSVYNVPLLITEYTFRELKNKSCTVRMLDTLLVKGKSIPITIYEVFNKATDTQFVKKIKSISRFETAVKLYQQQKFDEALSLFEDILEINKTDTAAAYYVAKCQKLLSY